MARNCTTFFWNLKSLLARAELSLPFYQALDEMNLALTLKLHSFQFNFNDISSFKSFQDFQLHSYKDFSSSSNVETAPAHLIHLDLILY
jgi:CRISPR/Cas system CMR-associated protein Cmr1 (group 7 of RAMP superfamily)